MPIFRASRRENFRAIASPPCVTRAGAGVAALVDARSRQGHHSLRGRRIGCALVETVLDWCRAHEIPRLILWSDTRFEQAHRLYSRMGFIQTGERDLPLDVNGTREYGFERVV